jgi:Flp pilus assembly protein TadD
MLRKFGFLAAIVAASVFISAGCASSYRHTEKAGTQIRFGKEVAKRGYWREARFRFEQAATKDPGNAFAHNDFAVALEANGEYSLALQEYKRALELAPNNKSIRQNYARFAEFYTSFTRTEGKKVDNAK